MGRIEKGKERLEESLNYVTAVLGSTSTKSNIKIDGFIPGSSSISNRQPNTKLNVISEEERAYSLTVAGSKERKNVTNNKVMEKEERELKGNIDNDIVMGKVVSVDLPRGWKNLKRLYTYDPKL